MRLNLSVRFTVHSRLLDANGEFGFEVNSLEELLAIVDTIFGDEPEDTVEIDDETEDPRPKPLDEELVIEGPLNRDVQFETEQTTGEGDEIQVIVSSGVPVDKFTVLQFPEEGADDSPEASGDDELVIEGPQGRTVTASFALNDCGSDIIHVLVKSPVPVGVFLVEHFEEDEGDGQQGDDDGSENHAVSFEGEDKAAQFGEGTADGDAFNAEFAAATEAAIASDGEIQELLRGDQQQGGPAPGEQPAA